jgi:hypothetical protein
MFPLANASLSGSFDSSKWLWLQEVKGSPLVEVGAIEATTDFYLIPTQRGSLALNNSH